MDAAGIDAALIHPPCSWDPDSNALAVEAARAHLARFAVMGQFPPDRPENRALIRGWRNQPGMMGLRWPLLPPEQQKAVARRHAWTGSGRRGARGPAHRHHGRALPADFRRIAEAHPGLKLILDHCGLVRTGQDEAAFARLDNSGGAGEAAQCRGQGDGRAALLDPALPLPEPA